MPKSREELIPRKSKHNKSAGVSLPPQHAITALSLNSS